MNTDRWRSGAWSFSLRVLGKLGCGEYTLTFIEFKEFFSVRLAGMSGWGCGASGRRVRLAGLSGNYDNARPVWITGCISFGGF